jgi:hypothetical protein
MSNNEQDNDHRGDVEMAKWRRKVERMADDRENAEKNLRGYLKDAFGKGVSETRLNMAREIKSAKDNPSKLNPDAAGYTSTQDGEITGMEDFPWNRDVE